MFSIHTNPIRTGAAEIVRATGGREAMGGFTANLCLVGLGPGDPDLLTPRSVAAMREADVVVCHASRLSKLGSLVDWTGKEVLDLTTPRVDQTFPEVRRLAAAAPPGPHGVRGRVRAALGDGRRVVALTHGDPSFDGQDPETRKALEGLRPEVVPGLSVFNAANALLRIRLGEVVISAPIHHRPSGRWRNAAACTVSNPSEQSEQPTLLVCNPHSPASLRECLTEVYPADCPVAVVTDAGRSGRDRAWVGTLAEIDHRPDDMEARTSLLYVGPAVLGAQYRPAADRACAKARFYLVGVGPGDAALATRRALAVIEKTDLILASQNIQDRFAGFLRGKTVRDGYERLFPFYGRDPATVTDAEQAREPMSYGQYQAKRAEFAALVRAALAQGRDVAMLDSGDPLVFGPSAWVLTELRDVATEVVPGLGAFNAGNAALGLDLFRGGNAPPVIFATAWSVEAMAVHQANMVLFTMRNQLGTFIARLSRHYSPHTPVAIVRHAGYAGREAVVRGRLGTLLNDIQPDQLPFEYLLYVGGFLVSETPGAC